MERDELYRAARADGRYNALVEEARWSLAAQRSTLFVEAPFVESFGLCGMLKAPCPSNFQQGGNDGSIYELRRYQLKLGYDTVPKFLELYSTGLPSKLSAPGTDPSTSLLTLLYTEVGSLNEVIELWRHGGGSNAMDISRQAARAAPEWRQAIAQIAELAVTFTSTIHRPVDFSPWK